MFKDYINEILEIILKLNLNVIDKKLDLLSDMIIDLIETNNKVLIAGNGGSAADSQHLAAELVVRFEEQRIPIPAISLTVDTSIITAYSNDYDFEGVFARQIEAIGVEKDILILFSTSGRSKNILKAADIAKKNNIWVVSFTGKDGGDLKKISDLNFHVPSQKTSYIQEIHQMFYHSLCNLIETKLKNRGNYL